MFHALLEDIRGENEIDTTATDIADNEAIEQSLYL